MRSTIGLVAIAGLVGLGACGGPDQIASDAGPPPDASTEGELTCAAGSGDRLRIMWIDSDGPAVLDSTVWDSQLETTCVPGLARDGVTRCLPSPIGTGTFFYSDAGCTSRLYLPTTDFVAAVPTYARDSRPRADSCGVDQFFSRIATPVTYATTQSIYTGGPGACTAVAAQARTYYTLAAELAADAPAALELVVAGGDRIEFQSYQSPDGARLCRGVLTDTALGSTCSLQTAEDGLGRCLPGGSAATAAFADAACTAAAEVVVHSDTCGALAPAYSQKSDTSYCYPRLRLRATTGALATAVFQSTGAPAVCGPLALAEGQVALGIGAGISPFTFAEDIVEHTEVGGRLRRGDHVVGGVRLQSSRSFDPELDVPCSFQVAVDGELRCLPVSVLYGPPVASGQVLFSDAACTAAVEVGTLGPSCQVETPRHAVRLETTGLRVFPVTGPLATPVFRLVAAVCTAVDTSLAPHFALGAEIPSAQFVAGTRRTE